MVAVDHSATSVPTSICQAQEKENVTANTITRGADVQSSRLGGVHTVVGTCPSMRRNVLIPHTNERILSVTRITP
jgi:hypothetical protein